MILHTRRLKLLYRKILVSAKKKTIGWSLIELVNNINKIRKVLMTMDGRNTLNQYGRSYPISFPFWIISLNFSTDVVLHAITRNGTTISKNNEYPAILRLNRFIPKIPEIKNPTIMIRHKSSAPLKTSSL